MHKHDLIRIIEDNIRLSFSRAGGPGGQNVNKVNTKVTARFALDVLCAALTGEELERLKTKLKNRITTRDELVLQVQDQRSQAENRVLAVRRIAALICNAVKPVKKRVGTKPTGASKEKRLQFKKELAHTKRLRKLL